MTLEKRKRDEIFQMVSCLLMFDYIIKPHCRSYLSASNLLNIDIIISSISILALYS